MFHSIEKYRTPAQVLLGLIALTFVGFGVSTVSHPGSDYIVQVGDEKISDHSINAAMQNEQAAGGSPSRDAVFQSLLQRAYLKQGAKLMGISVSQEQIKQIIVDDPNFHDAGGKFSHALLSQYLSQRHMSEDQFVEEIRNQFALQNLVNLVQNGVLVSDAQAEQLVKLTQVNRTIRSHTFNPDEFIGQVKAADADLQKFYNANKKDYLLPQAVKLEYVALNLKDFADKQTVSETEVKNAYEERMARLPAEGEKPSFEKEKAAVENELKMKKAVADFNKAKEKLGDDAFNHPSSLDEAAKNSGLKVETQETWLSRQDAQMSGMPENLINAVFSDDVLKKKHNSEVLSINNETAWVVRAKEVREEKTLPFAEAKDAVRQAYIRTEAAKLAENKAKETLAQLSGGKAVDVKWSEVSVLGAQQARQSMPPESYTELLKAKPANGKPAYVRLTGLPAPVIVEVQAITPPKDIAAQLPPAKQALAQQQSANTFDLLIRYFNGKIKQTKGAQSVDNGDGQ